MSTKDLSSMHLLHGKRSAYAVAGNTALSPIGCRHRFHMGLSIIYRQRCVIRNEQNRCIISKPLTTPQRFPSNLCGKSVCSSTPFSDYVAVATFQPAGFLLPMSIPEFFSLRRKQCSVPVLVRDIPLGEPSSRIGERLGWFADLCSFRKHILCFHGVLNRNAKLSDVLRRTIQHRTRLFAIAHYRFGSQRNCAFLTAAV
jgi:hypothetical protein